jgi:hypothetical protein
MAVLPSQLHVKLTKSDHLKLARLAKKTRLSISETVRQLIRSARVHEKPPA